MPQKNEEKSAPVREHDTNFKEKHVPVRDHDVNIMNYRRDPIREHEREQKILDAIRSEEEESTAVTVDGTVKTADGHRIIGHLENPARGNPMQLNNCDECTKHYSCETHAEREPRH